jgi:hypothetical protein
MQGYVAWCDNRRSARWRHSRDQLPRQGKPKPKIERMRLANPESNRDAKPALPVRQHHIGHFAPILLSRLFERLFRLGSNFLSYPFRRVAPCTRPYPRCRECSLFHTFEPVFRGFGNKVWITRGLSTEFSPGEANLTAANQCCPQPNPHAGDLFPHRAIRSEW